MDGHRWCMPSAANARSASTSSSSTRPFSSSLRPRLCRFSIKQSRSWSRSGGGGGFMAVVGRVLLKWTCFFYRYYFYTHAVIDDEHYWVDSGRKQPCRSSPAYWRHGRHGHFNPKQRGCGYVWPGWPREWDKYSRSRASLRSKKTGKISICIEDLAKNSVFFGTIGKPVWHSSTAGRLWCTLLLREMPRQWPICWLSIRRRQLNPLPNTSTPLPCTL